MDNLVSIIIPTYNRAHLIGETLESVLKQTYTNWECIIVDDGSSDNTDEVVDEFLKKDSRFKYYHRPDEHLPGGNGARNYGFKKSKGEFINWFDSDDLMKEKFIEQKLKLFSSKLDVVFCYGAYFNENEKPNNAIPSKPESRILTPLSYIKSEFYLSIAGPLWRKRYLEDKKLFDEKRIKLQDREFHFRMTLSKPRYYFYYTDALFYIRRTTNSISSSINISLDKVKDVFSYHYLTFETKDLIEDYNKSEYKAYTKNKALKGYYYVMHHVKSLNQRITILTELKSKLLILVRSESSAVLQLRTLFVIACITLFKKGFKFIK